MTMDDSLLEALRVRFKVICSDPAMAKRNYVSFLKRETELRTIRAAKFTGDVENIPPHLL